MSELVIGVPHRGPSVVTLPFDLAVTSPILQERGVTLEVVESDYDALSSWLATGRIQLCRRGPDVDVVAAFGGAPVESCAAVMQRVPADVVAEAGITHAGALDGRKVAVIHPTMGSTLALRAWLERQGVGPDRVELEVLGSTRARLAALEAGAVAAAIVTAPSASDLPAELRVLAALDEDLGPFLFSAVQVNSRAAVDRRDDIAAYLAAVMDAIERISSGAVDAGAVAGLLGVDAAAADAVLHRARRMGWYAPDMAFDARATEAMMAALERFGHVPAPGAGQDWVREDLRLAALGQRRHGRS